MNAMPPPVEAAVEAALLEAARAEAAWARARTEGGDAAVKRALGALVVALRRATLAAAPAGAARDELERAVRASESLVKQRSEWGLDGGEDAPAVRPGHDDDANGSGSSSDRSDKSASGSSSDRSDKSAAAGPATPAAKLHEDARTAQRVRVGDAAQQEQQRQSQELQQQQDLPQHGRREQQRHGQQGRGEARIDRGRELASSIERRAIGVPPRPRSSRQSPPARGAQGGSQDTHSQRELGWAGATPPSPNVPASTPQRVAPQRMGGLSALMRSVSPSSTGSGSNMGFSFSPDNAVLGRAAGHRATHRPQRPQPAQQAHQEWHNVRSAGSGTRSGGESSDNTSEGRRSLDASDGTSDAESGLQMLTPPSEASLAMGVAMLRVGPGRSHDSEDSMLARTSTDEPVAATTAGASRVGREAAASNDAQPTTSRRRGRKGAAGAPFVFEMKWNNDALPRVSLLQLTVTDQRGLLVIMTSALTGAGLIVKQAQVSTTRGLARDQFHVTDRDHKKITDEATQLAIRERVHAAVTGVTRRPMPLTEVREAQRRRHEQEVQMAVDGASLSTFGQEYVLPFEADSVHEFYGEGGIDDGSDSDSDGDGGTPKVKARMRLSAEHARLLSDALRSTQLLAPSKMATSEADAQLRDAEHSLRVRTALRHLEKHVLLASVSPGTIMIDRGEVEHTLFVVADGGAFMERGGSSQALPVGGVFGDDALADYTSSSEARVTVGSSGCSVLVVPHVALRQAARQAHEETYATAERALEKASLLQGLGKAAVITLARESRTVEFAPGESLCVEGAPLSSAFLIIQGQAVLRYGNRTLARMREGDTVGEHALARAASAAREACRRTRAPSGGCTPRASPGAAGVRSPGTSNLLRSASAATLVGGTSADSSAGADANPGVSAAAAYPTLRSEVEVTASGEDTLVVLALDAMSVMRLLLYHNAGDDTFTHSLRGTSDEKVALVSSGLRWNWAPPITAAQELLARSPFKWMARGGRESGETFGDLCWLAEHHTKEVSIAPTLAGVNAALDALSGSEPSRLYIVSDGCLSVTEEAEVMVESGNDAFSEFSSEHDTGDLGCEDSVSSLNTKRSMKSIAGGGHAATVHVKTRDRDGLLMVICTALERAGLRVLDADIATRGEDVYDSFAVIDDAHTQRQGDGDAEASEMSEERKEELANLVREAMVTRLQPGDAFVWTGAAHARAQRPKLAVSEPASGKSGGGVELLELDLRAAAKVATGPIGGALAMGVNEARASAAAAIVSRNGGGERMDPTLRTLRTLKSYLSWSVGSEQARAAGDSEAVPTSASGGCSTTLDDLEVLRPLGVGGFAVVRLARHKWSGEYFAVKLIPRAAVERVRAWPRVLSEARAMMALRHPMLLRLHAAQADAKTAYLVLDHVTGGDLFTLLSRFGGHVPERVVAFMMACVVLALEHIHEVGYAYRDVKPENILVDKMGYAKLADFGFARKLAKTERTFSFVGTPDYMAPECLRQSGHSASADWWALGVCMYQLLVGDTPFSRLADGRKLRAICEARVNYNRRGISTAAASLIRLLMQPDPGRRPLPGSQGAAQIKQHRFFFMIDWAKLEARSALSPYQPPPCDPEAQVLDSSFSFDHVQELEELALADVRAGEDSPLVPLLQDAASQPLKSRASMMSPQLQRVSSQKTSSPSPIA